MVPKTRILALPVLVTWAVKLGKKIPKLFLAVSARKFSKSTPAHIRMGRSHHRRRI